MMNKQVEKIAIQGQIVFFSFNRLCRFIGQTPECPDGIMLILDTPINQLLYIFRKTPDKAFGIDCF